VIKKRSKLGQGLLNQAYLDSPIWLSPKMKKALQELEARLWKAKYYSSCVLASAGHLQKKKSTRVYYFTAGEYLKKEAFRKHPKDTE